MQGRSRDALAPLETAAREFRDPETDTLLAIALRQAGRHEDALSRLKRATKRRPPNARAFHELCYLLFSLERYDEAVETLQHGLDIAPMMPELSVQLGYVFLQRKSFADAKLAFARALDISPVAADALYGLAKARQGIGENAPAAGYFRRYLVSRPDYVGVCLDLGHCFWRLANATPVKVTLRRAELPPI
jgi:tetratricopeptide (TPR) repeat protein